MGDYIKAARGKRRLWDIAALPVMDTGSEVRYYGSISKCGDNADWDWGMYQDEKGEWVLAEADGPGCIFNFTQHRYPTSAVPTFRFYFDHSSEPQFEIIPGEFGKKAPFLKPLADIFEGPEDEGRGPIWVVRSFVPMEFRTHCKVTSTIKLEGAEKAKGEGGWGHVTMHLYDSDEGLKTFDAADSIDELVSLYASPLGLAADSCAQTATLELKAGERKTVFTADAKGTICRVTAGVKHFAPELLENLVVALSFDGKETVRAPFGTFFGCEYGKTPAKLDTALLNVDVSGEDAAFANRYPMPFFEGAEIAIENTGKQTVTLTDITVGRKTDLCYDPANTGRFTASTYYPKTVNTQGENSLIADLDGHGQMVYGVISGEEIECGCEGDVRVFLDSLSSPSVESDGSESWGSYGWGFVCPPQCNPFSAYNGVPNSNNTWSELRLTFTDAYPFRSRLRFELEHGCQNDGGGSHSGQVFCYMLPEAIEQEVLVVNAGDDAYMTDGQTAEIKDRFENGIHEHYHIFKQNRAMTYARFEVALPDDQAGLVLKRVATQQDARMEAAVLVDGVKVTERNWLYPDYNDIYRLLEDTFTVPAKYTAGKKKVTVEIRPADAHWNDCRYRVFALKTK